MNKVTGGEPRPSNLRFEASATGTTLSLFRENKTLFIPAIICAGICVIMMRTGILSLFFLLPLGFCCIAFGATAAWLGFVFAVLGNTIVLIGFSLYFGIGLANVILDMLYFAVLVMGFTWVMANTPRQMEPFIPQVRTVYRLIAAAVVGSIAFLAMMYTFGKDETFQAMIRSQVESLSAMYIASTQMDAVRQSFLERVLTPDRIIATLSMIGLRGGALVTAVIIFFFSRQGSFVLAMLLRRQTGTTPGKDLIGFYVPQKTIWVLTLCFPVIVIFRAISLGAVEIIAWNLLVICVMMFLAQGVGIVMFALARRPMPVMMRLLSSVVFVFVLLSLSILAVGLLILLGIAENWLPLRKKGDQGVESRE